MPSISMRSKLARGARTYLYGQMQARSYDSMLLQGRQASWHVRAMQSVQSLQDVEFKVFSQWGEDGIIDWLIERAAIPPRLHSFVEFGVELYQEANTRFLLENRNWRGLILDGNPTLVDSLQRDTLFWRYDLTAKSAFITRENINELMAEAGFSGEIGLLSIDVDGNDYWIWEAIRAVQPVICVCEYNAVFGDIHAISIPYDPNFVSGKSHFSYQHFGASIAALRLLAAKKGYRFVGTNLAANNAFFIREDYAARVEGVLKEAIALPAKSRTSRDRSGHLSYVGDRERFALIAEMPVVRTETGERVILGELGPMYSEEWLQHMRPAAK